MFIVKLVYGNSIKKIKFLQEYQKMSRLRQIIQEITKYEDFKLSFIDMEKEKIFLEDDHDMEYFLAQSNDKLRTIIIENTTQEDEEFVDIQKSQSEIEELKEEQQLEDQQNKLKEELKDLILKEEVIEEPAQTHTTPKIYQQKDETIKKVQFPKSTKKIKKPKNSAQIIQSLKKNMNKTERQIKRKLQKMQKQLKKLEETQKKEMQEVKDQKTTTVIQEKPTQSGVRILTQHLGYVCDKCQKGPIIGIRYHCIVCSDYDLCQNCEQQTMHTHPMIRIMNQQTKHQMDQILSNYLNNDTQQEMQIEEEQQDKDIDEKMELLSFMFPVKDALVQKELANRYRHLNIEEFYEQISQIAEQN